MDWHTGKRCTAMCMHNKLSMLSWDYLVLWRVSWCLVYAHICLLCSWRETMSTVLMLAMNVLYITGCLHHTVRPGRKQLHRQAKTEWRRQWSFLSSMTVSYNFVHHHASICKLKSYNLVCMGDLSSLTARRTMNIWQLGWVLTDSRDCHSIALCVVLYHCKDYLWYYSVHKLGGQHCTLSSDESYNLSSNNLMLPGLSGNFRRYWLENGLPSGNRGFRGIWLSR